MKQHIFIIYNPRFLFLWRNRVLQTYLLKMNLALEIQMDSERNSETLSLTLLLLSQVTSVSVS
jgi:hypothetical protein